MRAAVSSLYLLFVCIHICFCVILFGGFLLRFSLTLSILARVIAEIDVSVYVFVIVLLVLVITNLARDGRSYRTQLFVRVIVMPMSIEKMFYGKNNTEDRIEREM